MEGFEAKLQKAGLTGNEAKVYLELLKQGELPANKLAKKIGMDRTLSYTVLNNLVEKGFIGHIKKENKKLFKATDPENLLNPIKEKEIVIKDLIGQLKKIQKIKDIPYEIMVYEGKEGLKNFIRIVLKHGTFCSFGATGRAYDLLYEIQALAKEFSKKGHEARMIAPPKFKRHEITKIKNIKIKYLDIKSEATTSIFGDYISIHIITQKPLLILIKNKEIAESYQNHFEVLWKIAKP